MGTYEQLREAILGKQQVVAIYGGLRREFCPHLLGTLEQIPRVFVYQFAGESKNGLKRPGSPENWRCMDVDAIRILEVRNGTWHTARSAVAAASNKRQQRCMDTILLRVSYD